MKYELEMLRLNTGREVEISTAVTRLVNHLFQYGVRKVFLAVFGSICLLCVYMCVCWCVILLGILLI